MNQNPNVINRERTLGEQEVRWNVINENNFKEITSNVVDILANTLKNTLGPYGSTSIIENRVGDYMITKDGWNVLKNIRFNTPIESNMMTILLSISQRMVTKVGDGSTSAIIATKLFLDKLKESGILNKYRRKDINDAIRNVVDVISEKIQANATLVTNDNYIDIVEKVANIATNESKEFSSLIREIYEKSGIEVNIRLQRSPNNNTFVKYEQGKYISRMDLFDNIYLNDADEVCTVHKPTVIMFDHILDPNHYAMIRELQSLLGKKLLVIAPNIDSLTAKELRNDTEIEISRFQQVTGKNIGFPFRIIFARAQLVNNFYYELYHDLAALIGCKVLTFEESNEIALKLKEYKENITNYQALYSKLQYVEKEEREKLAQKLPKEPPKKPDILELLTPYISELGGNAVLGRRGSNESSFEGFINKNENLLKAYKDDARFKFKELEDKYSKEGIIKSDYYDARNRLYRLECNTATIFVGGATSFDKGNNHDSLDDAIKACSSTINNGYNIGGNLIIPITINKLKESDIQFNELETKILDILTDTFKGVFYQVLSNKFRIENSDGTYTDETDKINEIIENCINNKSCFNLITDEYDNNVINSCMTDIEILRGAISVISIFLTCNQYISLIIK